MREIKIDRSAIVSICLGICLFLLFLVILTPNYETNDDPVMSLIVSGGLTGIPDEHMIFSNILFGHLLKGLYILGENVRWYPLYILSTHLISMVVIFLSFTYQRRRETIEMLLLVLIYVLGYFSLFLVKLQFTATAFMCGFSALLFLQSQYPLRTRLLVSGFLLVWATLIRTEVFIPLLIIGLTSLIKFYYRGISLRPYLLFFLLLTGIYTGARCYNARDADYRISNYYPTIKAADILYNKPTNFSSEFLKPYKLTQNDMNLFYNWFWVDRENVTGDKIISISKNFSPYKSGLDLANGVLTFFQDERYCLLMLAVSLIALFGLRDKKARIFIVANTCIVGALLFYLILTARLPKRVSTPMLLYLLLLNIGSLLDSIVIRQWKYAILAVLFVLAGYKFWCVYQLSEMNKADEAKFLKAAGVVNQHPDELFIVVGAAFPIETMNVFTKTPGLFKHKNLIFTGCWFVNTPVYDKLLQINGVQNVLEAIRDRREVVLVMFDLNVDGSMRFLENYFFEHDNLRVKILPDEKMIGDLRAYRLVPQ